MGPEEILVTEFGRHASLSYNELYRKNFPLPPEEGRNSAYSQNITTLEKTLLSEIVID